ncbi:MAG: long-chain fatty acid--CoA ligase [Persephonella sp.]|nr:MAG: long-chain fatty acid--CoA ligase [Persephonella sp.]RUM61875.1 MAG: long-chain fatty acid--CoA ligase [Persephonella sp.]
MAKFLFNDFYSVLEHHAKRRMFKKFIFFENKSLSYLRFKAEVDRLSYILYSMGYREGYKIAILLRNSPDFLISLLAIQRIGAIPVPINTFLKEEEIKHILEHSEAKLLIAEGFYRELGNSILWKKDEYEYVINDFKVVFNYENIKPVDIKYKPSLDDTAVILYTSGTTGKPKGVMLSYRNLISNVENIAFLGKVSSKDRFIVYLPMFHTFTLTASVLLPLYLGGSIVIIKSVFPFSNVLKQVLLKRVSIFLGVPEVYNALSKANLPWYFKLFNRIRFFVSGGAPLPIETYERMKKQFPKTPLIEGYGLTECSPVVSINPPEKPKPMSVGLPLPDYSVKIVDDNFNELPVGEIGEIVVKGDCVMKGYYKDKEETEKIIKDGWLLTGDLGRFDEEGYLYIVDRKKDLIISKGINIYPRDIEEVLNSHPNIEVSAVVGKKDKTHGEIPVAFVKLAEGVKDFTEKEIKRFLKNKIADYKIPKHIIIVDDFPRNATGKILKRKLKEMLENGVFNIR